MKRQKDLDILGLPGRQELPADFESLPGARYRVARETDVTGELRISRSETSTSFEPERPARLPPTASSPPSFAYTHFNERPGAKTPGRCTAG